MREKQEKKVIYVILCGHFECVCVCVFEQVVQWHNTRLINQLHQSELILETWNLNAHRFLCLNAWIFYCDAMESILYCDSCNLHSNQLSIQENDECFTQFVWYEELWTADLYNLMCFPSISLSLEFLQLWKTRDSSHAKFRVWNTLARSVCTTLDWKTSKIYDAIATFSINWTIDNVG